MKVIYTILVNHTLKQRTGAIFDSLHRMYDIMYEWDFISELKKLANDYSWNISKDEIQTVNTDDKNFKEYFKEYKELEIGYSLKDIY